MVREVGHRLRGRVSSTDRCKQDENGRNTLRGTSMHVDIDVPRPN